MQLPYIFILDWDGTIAGKVDFQSYGYSIRNSLKQYGFKPNENTKDKIPKAFRPRSKLIRPGFASFIKAMRAHFNNNVYFFVYTASEKHWAHQEIQWLEKAHGIKFQRPIFTRDDCVVNDESDAYRKSITKVFPRIMRAISNKKKTYTKSEKEIILAQRTMIIDNNPVYVDNKERMLLCPHYNYAVFEHLYDIIPANARSHPEVQRMMLGMINAGVMCPFPTHDDEMHAIYSEHSWIASKCKSVIDLNSDYITDDFWKRLRKLIVKNDIRTFTDGIIIKLQNAIWKAKAE